MSSRAATRWLVREKSGRIDGPLPYEELRARIAGGKVRSDAEICPENGYWISFHEMDELKRHFSAVDLELALGFHRQEQRGSESTKTDFGGARGPGGPGGAGGAAEKPARESSSAAQPHAAKAARAPQLLERGQFFMLLFFGGILAALLGVLWILNRLGS